MSTYKKSSTARWIIGAVSLLVVLLIGLGIHSQNTASKKTNREVALTCTTDMATKFHIHPHLEIIINNQKQETPANIGIAYTCMNALHTHDTSGIIHVESPEIRDFILADFFAVWNKPFNKDQILDYKVDAQHTIRVTVNGSEVQDFENTVLRDKDQIVINYESI